MNYIYIIHPTTNTTYIFENTLNINCLSRNLHIDLCKNVLFINKFQYLKSDTSNTYYISDYNNINHNNINNNSTKNIACKKVSWNTQSINSYTIYNYLNGFNNNDILNNKPSNIPNIYPFPWKKQDNTELSYIQPFKITFSINHTYISLIKNTLIQIFLMKPAKNLPKNFTDEGIIWLTWNIAEQMLENPPSTNPLLPEVHLINNIDYFTNNTDYYNNTEIHLGNYIYKQYTSYPKLTTLGTDNHVAILMNKEMFEKILANIIIYSSTKDYLKFYIENYNDISNLLQSNNNSAFLGPISREDNTKCIPEISGNYNTGAFQLYFLLNKNHTHIIEIETIKFDWTNVTSYMKDKINHDISFNVSKFYKTYSDLSLLYNREYNYYNTRVPTWNNIRYLSSGDVLRAHYI
jgi:hypothetical protein